MSYLTYNGKYVTYNGKYCVRPVPGPDTHWRYLGIGNVVLDTAMAETSYQDVVYFTAYSDTIAVGVYLYTTGAFTTPWPGANKYFKVWTESAVETNTYVRVDSNGQITAYATWYPG